jgi:S1-C subfamily serine protease
MRLLKLWLASLLSIASSTVHAQSADDNLRVYGASIINSIPFERRLSGYGIYLGDNAILTAAHVVGHWSLFSDPKIAIANQEIPAKVIKKGSFPDLDLALLVVADDALPVSLRLRRNLICKAPPNVGMSVVVVYPDRTVRSHIVSALAIAPQRRAQFGTVITEPQGSGSGVFDPERKCLLGIMSAAVLRSNSKAPNDRLGYFVPASMIATFIPAHIHF